MTRPFADRHIGPSEAEISHMLATVGAASLEELSEKIVPGEIYQREPFDLPEAVSESRALRRLRLKMSRNKVFRSFIGQGYYGTVTPPVIQRSVLENPGWYTAYTPYQAEISQGRLEALLNFQTLICELTGLPVSNASLLDEATAAAEAMAIAQASRPKASVFLVDHGCFPQTIDVLRTRALPLGIAIEVADLFRDGLSAVSDPDSIIGALVQYPTGTGGVYDWSELGAALQEAKAPFIAAADPLALTVLRPPAEMGADIVVGSAQRFGVPLGFGGPHAGFIACSDKYKRRLPGRLVGVSRDADGRAAFRLSLQTREQHIRREKATSNICTAQVLLAVMAGFYALYHGPDGLRRQAFAIHSIATKFALLAKAAGYQLLEDAWFDTIAFRLTEEQETKLRASCEELEINLCWAGDGLVSLSFDEQSIETNDWKKAFLAFGLLADGIEPTGDTLHVPTGLARDSKILQQEVFHKFQSETEMLRYMRRLEGRDIALNWSMIPLGSCTMKLNAAAEMMPLSWPEVANIHPFAPTDQASGYLEMITELETWLATLTGFHAVSLQPNAGSQGEYAGLLAIRRYHESRDDHRPVCLIPVSAHGTNPASAVMAGFRVVAVECDREGNVDVSDLRAKAQQHASELGALMITYPSTHGVFEAAAPEICRIVHEAGGLVYMDGANLNAQVGLCTPGDIGADVCHLNLHKTFCIPHGGGGPGVGPIGVTEALAPFLPGHRLWVDQTDGAVCGAPYGSASILTISWMYLTMMGPQGLRRATQVAILSANYMAKRLESFFPVLYRGAGGWVAHECILDTRPSRDRAGIDVEDVAKRLIDYGFHAPTMSWPVAGTLMIEPTESEGLAELDRFCDAMIAISSEIEEVASGKIEASASVLKNAPHPAENLMVDEWERPYTREQAAYPAPWCRTQKFWPSVSRIDNVFGDRNLVCTCDSVEAYAE